MSLIATRIQNWRVATPDFDKNMTRPSEYGALDFFVSQTDSGRSFLTPELKQKARDSIGTTVELPAINYDGDVTVGSVRSCTIADADNTSVLIPVTFATYTVGFTMVPAMHMNNDISYQHDFRRKMEKSIRALADKLDQDAVAALEARKSQVFKDLLIYEASANTVEVPWDLRNEILGDLKPIMRANDYRGQLHVIGNAGIDSHVGKLAQHGLYNDVNKQLEYANKVFHYTNNITNEEGIYAGAIVAEDGQVGIVTRAHRENRLRTKSNHYEWDIVRMPILELPVDTMYYTEVGSQAGVAGESTADMVCNKKEFFGFAIDVAFLVSYNSDPATIAEPIMKFTIGRSTNLNPMALPVNIIEGAVPTP